jgi:5-histidylcysteine sulfoxide synthase/putative 4-mercaptohistidine N1-methyltranferase
MNRAPHRTISLAQGDPEQKREEVRRYFHDTFDVDSRLYDILAGEETFRMRADPLRHPLVFYFGHTAAFYVNKLVLAKLLDERINPAFESIFAIGVDEMSWDDLNEANYDWPSISEVVEYRERVCRAVEGLIDTLPLTMPIDWDSPWWPILMGIEHQRIHLETSSVLIRQLPLDQVRPLEDWRPCAISGEPPANELLDVPGGEVVLGKERDHPLYGWDNEYGHSAENVASFAASRFLVSNGEFRSFVEAGGYEAEKWWTEEGWKWRSYQKATHPCFWVAAGDTFRLRLVAEEVAMPWDWPVEVNYLEAKAFCNWMAERTGKPIRLPTEEEWYRLHEHARVPDVLDWEDVPGNLGLEQHFSPCPVAENRFGDFADVIGNVWQWMESPIFSWSGFEVHPLYDDFSAPTFEGLHNLIKGGSWISTGNEATKHARYAFRRHFFQHAGFRYVESDQPVTIKKDAYETDQLVSMYCEAHYGEDRFGVPNYAKACAELCFEATEGKTRGKALDLGCAVGRSSFELARAYRHVVGLDFSARFIRVGQEMKDKGYIQYVLPEEGDLVSHHERRLESFGLTGDRVELFQADACNLKAIHEGFDLVLAANLIDRLYSPRTFLTSIHERMNPGGVLVLTSPYTWLEEFTERPEWVGGFKRDGEPVTTLDGLIETLRPHFRLVGEPRDVPFVIRETKRKFQHTIAQATVWERLS